MVRCRIILEITPRFGAKKKEMKAIVEITITIQGPVGIAGATNEM